MHFNKKDSLSSNLYKVAIMKFGKISSHNSLTFALVTCFGPHCYSLKMNLMSVNLIYFFDNYMVKSLKVKNNKSNKTTFVANGTDCFFNSELTRIYQLWAVS